LYNGITFHNTKFNTKEASAEWKKGTQETARILRYEWLEMIRSENKYSKITTAHHANDNVETLLMNLFKGTGISGLHGIPVMNNHIIRPLLFAQKEDLQAYAQDNNISYRDDASNATDAYLRNAVRLHIIPAVKEWFPTAVQNVSESIEHFAQAELLYNKAIEQEKKKLIEQRGQDIYIPVRKLEKCVPLETICYELFAPYGFSGTQVPQILSLLHSETGHYVSSATHNVIRNRDFLIITNIHTEETGLLVIEGAPCKVETAKYAFSFSIAEKPEKIPTDSTIACLDMDKIEFPVILRKWKTGDYFYPLGMGMKKKKLSNFFIDNKVPLHEKEQLWVLECTKRIAWIGGMRLDERFKIKDNTKRVLVVKCDLK
jgi:tRNA(Ile)-lysidine synthase